MGLITNYTFANQVLGRSFSGPTNPVPYRKPEVMRNYFSQPESGAPEQLKRDSIPTGTNPPYSLMMGPKGGLMTATTMVGGSGTVSGSAAMGINISSTLTGTSDLTANASLIVQLAASLSGSGDLTASMQGVIQLAATLAGSGNMTAALSMIVGMTAGLSGSGGVTGNLRGTADMSANIFVNSGTATTNDLVAAIWNAVASNYNSAGTMGQKLNGAGSAGDPWSTNLPASYADGQAGKILAQIQTLVDELHRLQGLKSGESMTVDIPNGTRSAGDITLEITEPSEGVTIVTRV